MAIADGVERLLAQVGQADDLEEVGPLRERGQVHHLGNATATDDTDAERWHSYTPTFSRR